jgi:hypothetical protein
MHKDTGFFSLFNAPIANTEPARAISVEDFFQLLKGQGAGSCKKEVEQLRSMASLPKAQRSEYKKTHLPFVTPHGTFKRRESEGLIEASGLFVADLDAYGFEMALFMEAIKGDPYVRLVFMGPSGKGSVKIFFRIDKASILPPPSEMSAILNAVEGYLRRQYGKMLPQLEAGMTLLDKANKDLPRACFLSFDPDAYIGPEDGKRIDTDFIKEYSHIEPKAVHDAVAPKNEHAGKPKGSEGRLTLEAIAEGKLKAGESHHNEVISFAAAALRFGHTMEATRTFIQSGGWVSSESGESDPHVLAKTVEDIWTRYAHCDVGVEIIRQGEEIGFEFLTFTNTQKYGYRFKNLYHDGIRRMLEENGFCRREVGDGFVLARKVDGKLEEMTSQRIRDFAQEIIEARGDVTFNAWGQVHTTAASIKEKFLNSSHIIFNDTWLGQLKIDKTPLLKDTRDTMSFPFKNKIVTISKNDGIKEREWPDIGDAVVWRNQVIPHGFRFIPDYQKGVFHTFIVNVTGGGAERLASAMSGLGYMLHHYFNESEGQAVVLYDEAITDITKPMGGSGKGVIVNAISILRKTTKIDGKHFDARDKFKWQQVGPDTQVVWLDDVKKDFDFTLLHSNLTDGWTIERKFHPQMLIPPADSPKTIICSNSIIKESGGSTNKRRQFIIEVGDYYSSRIVLGTERPIEQEHGGLFYSDAWAEDEWSMFFSFLLTCALNYLRDGLVAYAGGNVERNRLRQRVGEEFVEWVDEQGFVTGPKYDKKIKYNDFRATYYGDTEDRDFKQRTFTTYIKHFAESHGWTVKMERDNFSFSEQSSTKGAPVTKEGDARAQPSNVEKGVEGGELPLDFLPF